MKLTLSNLMNQFLNSSQGVSRHFSSLISRKALKSSSAPKSLYRRLSPLADPNAVVPVLDQWVQEGKSISIQGLRVIITELQAYRKYKQALQVSHWMSDKRFIPLSPSDIAARMNLMFEVHGLEEVENYFKNVHQNLKSYMVYIAMLNCYCQSKCLAKAEVLMQELMEKWNARTALPFNIMMNLYHSTGNWEKIDNLMNEMEEKGIGHNKFTLIFCLQRCADASNVEGIDKILAVMEEKPEIALNFGCYAAAARALLNVGQVDKALVVLKKLEGLVATTKRMHFAFNSLLGMYSKTGDKDALHRIWTAYKQKLRISNIGYIWMMKSLLNFNDVDGIEKIFAEWESVKKHYDFRVLNVLINAYSNVNLEKAEALINKGLSEGGEPNFVTWYLMAKGYMKEFQIPKAVEALKKAIPLSLPDLHPKKEILETCVEYLERRGNVEKVQEFLTMIKEDDTFPGVDHERLLQFIKHGDISHMKNC